MGKDGHQRRHTNGQLHYENAQVDYKWKLLRFYLTCIKNGDYKNYYYDLEKQKPLMYSSIC